MSGGGGSFVLDTDPTTTFNGTAGTTYVLQWTITNGVCTASADQVTIRLDDNPLPVADAGTAQTLCATSTTLAANAATTGIGTWTIVEWSRRKLCECQQCDAQYSMAYRERLMIYNGRSANGVCPSTSDNVTHPI